MDISFARLGSPSIQARYAPVYWEPLEGSRERITALIALEPDISALGIVPPAAHVVMPERQLRAIFGRRGDSAAGILREVARYMTIRLIAGSRLDELDAPFSGFSIGHPRSVRGFSVEQLVSAAVQASSVFGSVEDLMEDLGMINERLTTPPTREFLRQVQSAFVGDSEERQSRFARTIEAGGTTALTLDYAHREWLVQFASLPATPRQATSMEREGETKLFEMISVRSLMEGADNSARPVLIINEQVRHSGDDAVRHLAGQTGDRLTLLSEMHHVKPVPVKSKEEAVEALESFV